MASLKFNKSNDLFRRLCKKKIFSRKAAKAQRIELKKSILFAFSAALLNSMLLPKVRNIRQAIGSIDLLEIRNIHELYLFSIKGFFRQD